MWTVYNHSMDLKVRPSELLGIDHPLHAYLFDNAILTFGRALRAELDSVQGKTSKEIETKQMRILYKWIPEASSERKYRDPAKDT